jgi:hypothetical protein
MAKYDDYFWVKVTPQYYITTDDDELREMAELMSKFDNPLQDDIKPYQNCSHNGLEYSFGGAFGWGLGGNDRYTSPNEPLIDVQLMRFWCLQVAQQLINNDSYTDQSHDNVKVDLGEDELKLVNEAFKKTFTALTKHTVDKHGEMIGFKKPKKFNFENGDESN